MDRRLAPSPSRRVGLHLLEILAPVLRTGRGVAHRPHPAQPAGCHSSCCGGCRPPPARLGKDRRPCAGMGRACRQGQASWKDLVVFFRNLSTPVCITAGAGEMTVEVRRVVFPSDRTAFFSCRFIQRRETSQAQPFLVETRRSGVRNYFESVRGLFRSPLEIILHPRR